MCETGKGQQMDQLYDDDDDDDDNDDFVFLSATKNVGRVPAIGPRPLPSLYFTVQQ